MTATRGFSFTTKYTTLDDFVAGFYRCCDRGSMVLNTAQQHLEGEPCAFKILLADKSPALVGKAIVREVFADGENRFGRPGVRLEIEQLAADSEPVFARLQAAREQRKTSRLPGSIVAPARVATVSGISSPHVATMTGMVALTTPARGSTAIIPAAARSSANPTPPRPARVVTATRIQPITVQIPLRKKVATASPIEVRAEGSGETATRTPGSTLVLPANPLMNLTDASLEGFIDCRLFEASSGAYVESVEPAGSAIPGLDLPVPVLTEADPPPLPPAPPAPRPTIPAPVEPVITPVIATPAIDDVRPRIDRRYIAASAIAIVAIAVVAWLAHDSDSPAQPRIAQPAPNAAPVAAHIATPVVAPVAAPPAKLAPQAKPPLYMVLVQSSPSAAGVTYGGKFVGYTPTYVHVPAATPVQIEIERKGWKPVTETITSQHPGDRVSVRLEHAGNFVAPRPQPKREAFERPPI